jgi:hypothetical protein
MGSKPRLDEGAAPENGIDVVRVRSPEFSVVGIPFFRISRQWRDRPAEHRGLVEVWNDVNRPVFATPVLDEDEFVPCTLFLDLDDDTL